MTLICDCVSICCFILGFLALAWTWRSACFRFYFVLVLRLNSSLLLAWDKVGNFYMLPPFLCVQILKLLKIPAKNNILLNIDQEQLYGNEIKRHCKR